MKLSIIIDFCFLTFGRQNITISYPLSIISESLYFVKIDLDL